MVDPNVSDINLWGIDLCDGINSNILSIQRDKPRGELFVKREKERKTKLQSNDKNQHCNIL